MTTASEERVSRDLDAMWNILDPFDDDAREGMLVALLMVWASQHKDRVEAITRLFDRYAAIENDIARKEMQ